jgi:hypothetical protein
VCADFTYIDVVLTPPDTKLTARDLHPFASQAHIYLTAI